MTHLHDCVLNRLGVLLLHFPFRLLHSLVDQNALLGVSEEGSAQMGGAGKFWGGPRMRMDMTSATRIDMACM